MEGKLTKIATREEGLGFEIYHEYFGLTCRPHSFLGYYDLWPFCQPYDAEEWWLFEDEESAQRAATSMMHYLEAIPFRSAPPRISFTQDSTGFHLTCNNAPAGARLFRGEDDANLWPFHQQPDWPNHATRSDAAEAVIKLQAYLDGRSKPPKAAKTKKSTKKR